MSLAKKVRIVSKPPTKKIKINTKAIFHIIISYNASIIYLENNTLDNILKNYINIPSVPPGQNDQRKHSVVVLVQVIYSRPMDQKELSIKKSVTHVIKGIVSIEKTRN